MSIARTAPALAPIFAVVRGARAAAPGDALSRAALSWIVVLGAVALLAALVALAALLGDRRRLRRRLCRRTELFERLAAALPQYAYWKSAQGVYLGCNARFAAALGKAPEEVAGKTDADLPWPPRTAARLRELDAELLRDDAAHSCVEERIAFPDQTRVCRITRLTLHDAAGAPAGILGLICDISSQKRLEQELLKMQRLRSLELLVRSIAHDFNNMLAGITSAADLLSTREADPSVEEYIRIIIDSSQKASRLIQRLLTFSGAVQAGPGPADVHRLIEESLSIIPRSRTQQIRFETSFNARRPIAALDPAGLQSALISLIINALEAMPDGGALRIATEDFAAPAGCSLDGMAVEEGPHIRVRISDTGQGMSEETRRHAFEPFYTTKGEDVPGLGLAGVYIMLKDARGAIAARGREGGGAEFELLLPRAGAAAAPGASYQGRAVFGRGRILVVDDEEVVRESTQFILQGLGYEALTAASGAEAVDIVRSRPANIDLVILDMIMPGMSGQDCFAALRAIRPDLPVIASTGYVSDMAAGDFVARGFAALLRKPYRRSELSQAVAAAISAGGTAPGRGAA
jgi:signal transduction histidine kinase/ActR/RegA family two-component response regulator